MCMYVCMAGEVDQIGKIFKVLGAPNEQRWPGFSALPNVGKISWRMPTKYACVCMYVCMYVYVKHSNFAQYLLYVVRNVCMYVCMYVRNLLSQCMYVFMPMYVCVCVYVGLSCGSCFQ